MKIVIIVEGETEKAFKPFLLEFLKTCLQGAMPKLKFIKYDGRIQIYEQPFSSPFQMVLYLSS